MSILSRDRDRRMRRSRRWCAHTLDRRHARDARCGPSVVGGDEAEVYRAAGFVGPQQFTLSRGEVIERSIAQVIPATFSLSSSTPRVSSPEAEVALVAFRGRRSCRIVPS